MPRLRQSIRSYSSCLAIWLQSVATTERCERLEFVVLLPIGQEMPKKKGKEAHSNLANQLTLVKVFTTSKTYLRAIKLPATISAHVTTHLE